MSDSLAQLRATYLKKMAALKKRQRALKVRVVERLDHNHAHDIAVRLKGL